METNTSSKTSAFTDRIGKMLSTAQHEIESLIDQLASGKTEVSELFEKIKKEFNSKTDELKQEFAKLKSVGVDHASALIGKMEALQVQLNLGKAEVKELFEEQRKKIMNAIHEFETELQSNPDLKDRMGEFNSELESFKLKLEILKLKFELKKFELKDDFRHEMSAAKIKINSLFEKVEEKKENVKKKYTDFGAEIDLAYQHLRKAVGKL